MRKCIVVGAGIIGASIAYSLSKEGADVTILEKAQPASGATSKSFGWINANYPETQEYFNLRSASMAEFHLLAAELDKDIGLKWSGSLWWESKNEAFLQHVNLLKIFNYAFELVDSARFNELEPKIFGIPEETALFPLEGAVDPIAMTMALIDQAKMNNATLVTDCVVERLIVEDDRCVGVDTPTGEYYGDTVIIAIGVHAENFLADAGIKLPMNNQEGIIIHIQPVEQFLNFLHLSPEIHFRQHTSGSIIVAEDFGGGPGNADPDQVADTVKSKLGKLIPDINSIDIGEITVGERPMPADGFPALGQPEKLLGLYVVSMHSGVTLSPIVGKLAAIEILDGENQALLNPYRLSRFTSVD